MNRKPSSRPVVCLVDRLERRLLLSQAAAAAGAMLWGDTFGTDGMSPAWGPLNATDPNNPAVIYTNTLPANSSASNPTTLQIVNDPQATGGRALAMSLTPAPGRDGYYDSAEICTELDPSGIANNFQYGQIDARIKLPGGNNSGAIWPAFWLLGDNISGVGWPACGEIDVMENRGSQPGTVLSTIHGPTPPGGSDYNGGAGVGSSFTLPGGQDFYASYHVFSLSWRPNSITFSVDGQAFETLTPANLPSGGSWVFNGHPFFVVLDVCEGGNFAPGTITSSQTMDVDYVRAYGSGPGITINNGVVDISGTAGSDTIAAGVDPGDSSQYYFLVQPDGQPESLQTFPISQVTGLQINCDPAGIGTSGANADLVNLGGSNFNMPVTINGGSGSDTIIGQRSPNFITTGAGSTHNIVYGSVGADSIVSQGFNDTMRSGGGRDTIRANTGNNVLVGGRDGSRLWAGNGHDTLRGGAGNSTLHGGSGGSLLIGGFGNDLLDAGSGFDTIIAGTGHSTLLGGASDDFLDAGWDAYLVLQGGSTMPTATLSDSVDGSASISDTLVASSGSPTIVGGSGNSIFAVNDPAATLQNVGSSFVARDDTVASATQTIKVHLTIQDSNGGVIRNVVIPNGAGAAPSGTSAAMTTSPNGRIQFESNGPRTFTLADFFNHWGVNFSVLGIGQFIASSGSGHTLGMTVNGVANTQFQNYAVHDGDNIVITFTQ